MVSDDLMQRLRDAIQELVEAEVERAFHDYECGCHDTTTGDEQHTLDAVMAEVRERLDELERRRAFILDRTETPSALLHAVARVLGGSEPTDLLARRIRLMARTRAMYEAAEPHLGARWAQDVAGNIAQACDAFSAVPLDVHVAASIAIRHRIHRLCMTPMSDAAIAECAQAMSEAWRRDR